MVDARQGKSEQFVEREFPMADADFQRIKLFAYKTTGINLSDHKKNMVYSRLARRLRRLNLTNFTQYCDFIEQKSSPELTEFTNAITTNLTAFFRENHHFDFLCKQVLPGLIKSNSQSKRIRIWSAGCSTGEEPYSIAMSCLLFREISTWDVKILATDLDSNVVQKASLGLYATERVEDVPSQYRRFLKYSKERDTVKVSDSAKALITFKQLNLLHDWPMRGPFDVIFCRNVVIYFDADTQKNLFDRYANILTEHGKLFIGHSETLHNVCNRFQSLGRTIYERSH